MAGPSTIPTLVKAPNDLAQWSRDVAREVGVRGFLTAWTDHFDEIVAAHASGKAADGLLGPTLQSFLMADPRSRPYVKDVSFAAPAAAAVGTIPAGGARPPHDLAAEPRASLRARAVDHPQVVEGDGKPMKYLPSLVFQEQLGLKQARSEV